MTYADDKFWEAYEEFVVESLPRHRKVLKGWTQFYSLPFDALVDLGCGRTKEALRLFQPKHYLGLDLSPTLDDNVMMTDYRNPDLPVLLNSYKPTCFSSLFSVEITKPFTDNYELYERLFQEVPSLDFGIVAGFYYEKRKGQLTVQETGGLTSYQSIEAQEIVNSDSFYETRTYVKAPSKLFGLDVVEVWKLFRRK